ncbi:MAG TPA: DUF1206 domain-containing protein [Gaiellaceae bacterium]|nr:DUF1206 domain-containing protein [Gaiellaceae bacterium]
MGETKRQAAKAADTPWARGLARWGLVSKGVLYLLVGLIATHVSIGGGERIQDRPGALSAVADNWLGKLLVGAVAIGLACYALWRFAEVLLGRTLEGGERFSVWQRLGAAARGVWFLGLFGIALSVLVSADESGSRKEDRVTARVLELPAGRWLVAAVGLGILGAGLFNLFRGVTGRFRERLKLRKMSDVEDRIFTIVGGAGYLARAVVFGLIGFFLVRAAWRYDPNEAVGLDGALGEIVRQDYGDTLLGLVATGLLAYGFYCFVEARYREV